MVAFKLTGWVDGILGHRPKAEIAKAHWFAVKPVPDMVRATLVVGEKAYTESEVRELIRSMIQLIDGDPKQVLAAIEEVNAKHGLGLSDPA